MTDTQLSAPAPVPAVATPTELPKSLVDVLMSGLLRSTAATAAIEPEDDEPPTAPAAPHCRISMQYLD